MRFMFPVIGLLAGYLLLRGHNLPGGGFVAGLALAVAVILQYMAGGTRWAEDRLSIRPMRWMGAGLLLGGATGAGAWLFAHPSSPRIPRICTCRCSASCTCRAHSCSTSASSRWWSAPPG